MSKMNEKIMIFIVLAVYYLLSADETHVTVILISFIAAFSIDVIEKKYMLFVIAAVFTGLLFIDINYVYYFPLLAHIIYAEYCKYGILALIPIALFQQWELLFLSI